MKFKIVQHGGASIDPNKPGETLRVSLGVADYDNGVRLGFIRRSASGVDGAYATMLFGGNDSTEAIARKLRELAKLVESQQL